MYGGIESLSLVMTIKCHDSQITNSSFLSYDIIKMLFIMWYTKKKKKWLWWIHNQTWVEHNEFRFHFPNALDAPEKKNTF